MRTISILILILICGISAGQDSSFIFLHSWKHEKKISKISSSEYLTVEVDYLDSLKENKVSPTSFSGKFIFIKNNILFMTIDQEETTIKKPNGTKKEISTYYTFPDSLRKITDGEIKEINIARINSISYSNEKPLSDIGFFITGLSFISALIVAPLVSVNFKNGDFRQNRYYNVLKGSAIGFTIGLPIGLIFLNNKSYNIKNTRPDIDDMNFYYLSDK